MRVAIFFMLSLLPLSLALSIGCEVPKVDEAGSQVASSNEGQREKSAASSTLEPAPETSNAPNESKNIDAILVAWQTSEDSAVQYLLAATQEDLSANLTSRVLTTTEEKFAKLDRSEKTSVQEDAGKAAKVLRSISRKCLALGDEALNQGDIDKARRYFEAVSRLGNALDNASHLMTIRMVGQSLVKSGNEALSRTNNASAN